MDDRAFERLFRDHYGALCAFALRYVREPSLAEELVQDLFAELWTRRATWQPRPGAERAYLLAAVRNRALNLRKRQAVEHDWEAGEAVAEVRELHPRPAHADHALETAELAQQIHAALESLPERCRLVMHLRWRDQLTYAQIAEVMGISINTVAGLRQDWSLDVATRVMLKWGIDARRERARYDYFGWRRVFSVDANNQIVPSFDTTAVAVAPPSTRLGAYLATRVQPVRTVTAELGVRFDRASHTGDDIVSPRFNLAWQPASRTTIRGAWGTYSQSQPLFALQAQDGESGFHPAERAEQRVVGVEQVMKNGFVARAELYERRLSHLRPRYINVGPAIEVFPEINWDRVRVDPTTGVARGLELFLARDGTQHVDWSMSYALANAREQIEGRAVPRAIDQRHTVHGDWSFRPTSNKWRLSVAWLWHSGWPYTQPLVSVDTLRNTPTEFQLAVRFHSGEIGAGRLPAYRRADVRWTRYFDTRKGRWSPFAEVYNLLNTQNPRGYYVNLNVDNQRRVTTTRGTEANIGRLPAAGITWEF